MAHYSQSADAIKEFLATHQKMLKDDLQKVARNYRSQCEKVNARLERCRDYLQRGLLCEAIHHAEMAPDVLDMVTALDLPEFDRWDQKCIDVGLDRAPQLMLDVATHLNEAYAREQPQRDLLRQFRLLSLAKAPLTLRLEALRSLAAVDSRSSTWDQDIVAFENARLAEIKVQARVAADSLDEKSLQLLLAEVTSGLWRIAVPEAVCNAIRDDLRRVQTTHDVADLKSILPHIEGAHMALHFADCQRHLERWDGIVARHSLSVPPDLEIRVKPAREWTVQQKITQETKQHFSNACAILARALDGEANTAELKRAYTDLRRFESPLPQELQDRYRQEMGTRASLQRRKTMLRLGAIGLAGVAGIVALCVSFYVRNQNAKVDQLCERVQQLLDNHERGPNEIEEARNVLERFKTSNPGLVDEPRIQEIVTFLARAEKEESSRKAGIDDIIKRQEGTSAGERSDEELERATKLARTPDEKMKIRDLRFEDDEIREKRNEEANRLRMAEWKVINDGIESLTTQVLTSSLDNYEKELKEWEVKFKAMEAQIDSKLSSTELASLIRIVKGKLKSKTDALAREKANNRRFEKEQAEFDHLLDFVSSPRDFAAKLSAFAKDHPEHLLAKDFKKAASRAEDWEVINKWMKLSKPWKSAMIPKSTDEINERANLTKKYENENPRSPYRDIASKYRMCLEKCAKAADPNNPVRKKLEQIVTREYMRNWDYIVVKGEGRVYIRRENQIKDSMGYIYQCYLGAGDGEDSERRTVKKGELKQARKESPQCALTGRIKKMIPTGQDRQSIDAVDFGLEIAEAIRQSTKVDPVLRAILLNELLTEIEKCAWGIDSELADARNALRPSSKVGSEWPNSRLDSVVQARRECEGELKRMNFGQIKMKRRNEIAGLERDLQAGFSGFGMLARQNGQWGLYADPDVRTAGLGIWVLLCPAGEGPMTWRKVGKTGPKKLDELNEAEIRDIPSGTLVFIGPGPGR